MQDVVLFEWTVGKYFKASIYYVAHICNLWKADNNLRNITKIYIQKGRSRAICLAFVC